ncbi:MAG: hypothetical protein QXS90_02630 [Candidatus Diapherotrites archaeon]
MGSNPTGGFLVVFYFFFESNSVLFNIIELLLVVMVLARTLDGLEAKVNEIRLEVTKRHWSELSRPGFIFLLSNVVPLLDELFSLFQVVLLELEKSKESFPELKAHCDDLSKLVVLLKRNKELEEKRQEKVKAKEISFVEDLPSQDLYSDLEQKTLSFLLKSSYMIDRLRIIVRKRDPANKIGVVQKNVLSVLEQREKELEDLRKKYEEIRKSAFFGVVHNDSSVEIENSLNELLRKSETEVALVKKSFESAKSSFESLEKSLVELSSRLSQVEEFQNQVVSKTFELIAMLKKERDYAKRLLMDVEQETLQLRNLYSKELLGLQEEKLNYKNSIEQKFVEEIRQLKRELKERNELVKQLQDAASLREQKIVELEKELEDFKVKHKTLHRHLKIKENLKKLESTDKSEFEEES